MTAKHSRKPRRGMAVLIVLAILSITLALSYSVMRSQVTAVQIQSNAHRRDDARQAAQTGVHAALRRMCDSDWAGTETSFSAAVGDNSGFTAAYTTGDDSLAEGDADYGERPYRVTITSTGYAADPTNANLKSTCTLRAVAQLIRRQRTATPNGWSTVQSYSVYQWKPESSLSNCRFIVEYPSRIEGRVRIQGALSLCDDYPNYTSATQRLMGDLNAKRYFGLGDERPFNSTIDLKQSYTSSATLALLWTYLGISTSDTSQSTAADWEIGAISGGYRLYPGGKEYPVQTVSSVLQNITLEPDPETNPLGIFYHVGRIDIRDNVTIRGTLIVVGDLTADVYIDGDNVQFEGVNLAALEGATQSAQLPVIVAGDDLRILGGTSAAIDGMVIVNDEFEVAQSNQNATIVNLRGRLMCKELILNGRNEWDESSTWYQYRLSEFYYQLYGLSPTLFFPDFLENRYGLVTEPKLVIKGPATPVTYHWQDASEPVLAPHANDEALVWDLIEWRAAP